MRKRSTMKAVDLTNISTYVSVLEEIGKSARCRACLIALASRDCYAPVNLVLQRGLIFPESSKYSLRVSTSL